VATEIRYPSIGLVSIWKNSARNQGLSVVLFEQHVTLAVCLAHVTIVRMQGSNTHSHQ
jgi:ABC-type branched-subunit amino acid transport system ATPase component